LTVNALTAASSVLVPIQCEFYALEGLSQLMKTIGLVQKNLNPSLQLEGVVLTMFDARTNLSIQVVDEVKKHFRIKFTIPSYLEMCVLAKPPVMACRYCNMIPNHAAQRYIWSWPGR